MSRAWRSTFALFTCCAVACAPILGLDEDFKQREATATDAGPETGPDAGQPCDTNAECIERDKAPSLCVARECKRVNKTLCLEDIKPSVETLKEPGVIVVAAFLPIEDNPFSTGPGLAYELAAYEIEQAGGIKGRTEHKLAVMVCDSDPKHVKDAVKHAVNELRVPAIIGAFGSRDLADLVPNTIAEAGVFTVNPSYTNDALKFAETNRLVWGLLGTAEDVARTYRPLLQELKDTKLQSLSSIKVALVASTGSLELPMADLVEKGQVIPYGPDAGDLDENFALEINGGPPRATKGVNFQRWDFTAKEFGPLDTTRMTQIKNELIAYKPDVIIALTTDEELESFFLDVDTALDPAVNDGGIDDDGGADGGDAGGGIGVTRAPYWLLGPNNGHLRRKGGYNALGEYLNVEKMAKARRRRFVGVQYAGPAGEDKLEGDEYRNRMTLRHKEAGAAAFASENCYDAVYWLAYGIAGAGPSAPVNGTSFREGARTLLAGPAIRAGTPTTVQGAFDVIRDAKGARFIGALGPPKINTTTQTWESVGGVYCYPQEAPILTPTYDVRRYEDGGLDNATTPINCTSN